jgi:predicted nucleotidyltransferase component of viral defense system
MRKEVKNIPASIHDRLKRLARTSGRPFQEYLYYYAIERFLYRLSCSKHKELFVLKGGLMFFGWGIPLRRPTRDIDLQGYLGNRVDELISIVKEICTQEVDPDGMRYDPDSIREEQIIDIVNYPGVRVYFTGYLGQASIHLHLDISFANVITPGEITFDYPTLLGFPVFSLRGYPIETAIAEKVQAMVILENINDRMKDFYDVWLLSQQVDLPGETLVDAIRATFAARETRLPTETPTALSGIFAEQRQTDWEQFLKRSLLDTEDVPAFIHVIDSLNQFLWPILIAASREIPFELIWKAGGPWQEK